jgi:hypothetical protein
MTWNAPYNDNRRQRQPQSDDPPPINIEQGRYTTKGIFSLGGRGRDKL